MPVSIYQPSWWANLRHALERHFPECFDAPEEILVFLFDLQRANLAGCKGRSPNTRLISEKPVDEWDERGTFRALRTLQHRIRLKNLGPTPWGRAADRLNEVLIAIADRLWVETFVKRQSSGKDVAGFDSSNKTICDARRELSLQIQVLDTLCVLLDGAVRRRDERGAFGFLEATRCVALVTFKKEWRRRLGAEQVAVQADIQNRLWTSAVCTAGQFIRFIQDGIDDIRRTTYPIDNSQKEKRP